MKILVTGGAGGIGNALSERLIREGHEVFSFTRQQCDITDPLAIKKALEKMMQEGFTPDCVILAAGVFENDLLPVYNRTLVDKNFAVNFFGALNIIDILLPFFLLRGGGHFIALSSLAAFRPNLRGVGYPASKAALSLAIRGFDLAYREQGVAFSVAYIGPVKTRMWAGGDSFLTVSPEHIAGYILRLIYSRKPVSFMPFFSTAIARVGLLIPDRLYLLLRKTLLG